MKNIKISMFSVFCASLLVLSLNSQSFMDLFESMDNSQAANELDSNVFKSSNQLQLIKMYAQDNDVFFALSLKDLKAEDIKAAVVEDKFQLVVNNNSVKVDIKISNACFDGYIEHVIQDENSYSSNIESIVKSLPTEVAINNVAVEYNNGELIIRLPRKEMRVVPVAFNGEGTEKVEVGSEDIERTESSNEVK